MSSQTAIHPGFGESQILQAQVRKEGGGNVNKLRAVALRRKGRQRFREVGVVGDSRGFPHLLWLLAG
jgi:hypothetical protein